MKTIVLTGPESTGKSSLCEKLAQYYNSIFIPEYARFYVENLRRPYTYRDIELIAHHQVEELQQTQKKYEGKYKYLFVDTYLVITKIWFQVCYNKYPDNLQQYIDDSKIDLFLLCKPDIKWVYDPVRENGTDDRRVELYDMYKNEIILMKVPFYEVSGIGNIRLNNAIRHIDMQSALWA